MSFVTLAGPKSDIDRVIDTYLSKYEIQLENALVELNSSGNLLPYVEANPYKDILDKSHALLELMDESIANSPLTDMSVEEATNVINNIDDQIKDLKEEINTLNIRKDKLNEDYDCISPFKNLEYDLKQVLGMNYIKYRFVVFLEICGTVSKHLLILILTLFLLIVLLTMILYGVFILLLKYQ